MPEPTVAVRVIANTQGLQAGLASGEQSVKLFAKNVTLVGNQMGSQFTPKVQEGKKGVQAFASVAAGFAIGAGMALFKVITKGVSAMSDFVKGGVMYAAQVSQMSNVLALVGRQQGITAKAMEEGTKAIRDVGIETGTAQQMLAQFTRMQFEVADAVKVSQAARDLAVISGANTSETAARIMHGIMTRQTDVLRMAGVNVGSLDAAYEKYATTIGKTRSQLTKQEQDQAVLNAVLEEAAKVQGAAAEADKNAIKQLGSLTRIIKEIALEAGRPFVNAFSSGVYVVKKFTDAILEMIREGGQLRPMLDKIGAILTELTGDMEEVALEFIENLPEMVANVNATADSVVVFGSKVAGVFATVGDLVTALSFPFTATGKLIAGTFDAIVKGAIGVVSGMKAVGLAITGDLDGAVVQAKIAEEAINQSFESIVSTVADVYVDDLRKAGEAAQAALSGESFRGAEESFLERFARNARSSTAVLDEVTDEVIASRVRVAQAEEQLLASTKSSIAEQLKAQWELADKERQIAAQRAQIRQQYINAMQQATLNFQKGQQQAAVSHGEQMVEIEENYQEQIDDILRNYAMARDEAIANRDALALRRAENRRDDELSQAEKDRDKQKNEAATAYQKQVDALKATLIQQQAAAEQARIQQMEALRQQIAAEEEEKRRQAERERILQEVSQATDLNSLSGYLNERLRRLTEEQLTEYNAAVAHYERMLRLQMRTQQITRPASGERGDRPRRMARGGAGVARTPTTFLAGEAGRPEAYAFAPGGSGATAIGNLNVTQQFSFAGRLTEEEKDEYKQIAADAAINLYDQIMGD